MENLTPVTRPDEPSPVPMADVRDVPLDKLASDDRSTELVRRVMNRYGSPSRVEVAMFDSAI
jgi:FXSXX-COOH protein